ncbi:SDR family oxidoreductase [Gracilibacillus sp. D59]|uniref:SDR family oxidoreductase n=1 Tax=Gracilibacillus sp. D59 TaxID=3457434 RepID=UPI003FCD02BC
MKYLITGANRGLGLHLTEEALKRGHQVFATTRKQQNDHLQELKDNYTEALTILILDVQSEEDVEEAAKKLRDNSQKLDVLINNAAILNEREKSIEDLDIELCSTAFDINVLGPMRIVKHFLPLMNKGTSSSILNISSEAASFTNAYAGDYPYGISKAALNMLSEKLSKYLKEEQVQVLSIHPGWMKTDMGGEKAPFDPIETAEMIIDLSERKKEVKSRFTFVNRDGSAMDI